MEHLYSARSKYKQTVIKNQSFIEEIETAFKYLSYLIAGRFEKSAIWAELANVTSNMLRLVHRHILKEAEDSSAENESSEKYKKIVQWLQIVDHMQVFLELSSHSLGGNKMRWFIIFLVEVIKVVLKVILLMKYKKRISSFSLNVSDELVENNNHESKMSTHRSDSRNGQINPSGIILKRSGRILKSLTETENFSYTPWKFENTDKEVADDVGDVEHNPPADNVSERNDFNVQGELVHIMRPLIHLSTMYFFGTMSWKPFLLSLATDVASLKIVSLQKHEMNKREKAEFDRRKLALMCYALRSPLFDVFTKKKILGLMKVFTENIPLVGVILNPMLEYLPEWQKIYFYTWDK